MDERRRERRGGGSGGADDRFGVVIDSEGRIGGKALGDDNGDDDAAGLGDDDAAARGVMKGVGELGAACVWICFGITLLHTAQAIMNRSSGDARARMD